MRIPVGVGQKGMVLTPAEAALLLSIVDAGLVVRPDWEHGDRWYDLKVRLERCARGSFLFRIEQPVS